jgi:putative transposase
VPALDQEFLQGLSLWKYRVIRSFNQSKGRTVDLSALGHAQRKIQAEVDQSLISKKLKNRSRIARWQASGHISSLAGEGSANSNDSSQERESLELSSINLEQSFEELEQVGWGLEQSSLSHNGRKQND